MVAVVVVVVALAGRSRVAADTAGRGIPGARGVAGDDAVATFASFTGGAALVAGARVGAAAEEVDKQERENIDAGVKGENKGDFVNGEAQQAAGSGVQRSLLVVFFRLVTEAHSFAFSP